MPNRRNTGATAAPKEEKPKHRDDHSAADTKPIKPLLDWHDIRNKTVSGIAAKIIGGSIITLAGLTAYFWYSGLLIKYLGGMTREEIQQHLSYHEISIGTLILSETPCPDASKGWQTIGTARIFTYGEVIRVTPSCPHGSQLVTNNGFIGCITQDARPEEYNLGYGDGVMGQPMNETRSQNPFYRSGYELGAQSRKAFQNVGPYMFTNVCKKIK